MLIQVVFIIAAISQWVRSSSASVSNLDCFHVPLHGGFKICGNLVLRDSFKQQLEFPIDQYANVTFKGNYIEINKDSPSVAIILQSLKYKKNINVLNAKQVSYYLNNEQQDKKKHYKQSI